MNLISFLDGWNLTATMAVTNLIMVAIILYLLYITNRLEKLEKK